MRRRAVILLCSVLLGAVITGGMLLPERKEEENTAQEEPGEVYAWWSLTCETPNPDRLPVRVRFQWLKGLE